MLIETRLIEELIPADYNPRVELLPGDPEFEKLRRSIETFGFVEPMVWNRRTGRVIGGHQRLNVAKHLGYKELSVVAVDLEEPSEKALNIALNKISGEWDLPKLKDLLEELDTGDFNVTLTGFGEEEIEQLLTQFHVDEPLVVEEDDFDVDEALDSIREPRAKPGDLWILGQHRVAYLYRRGT